MLLILPPWSLSQATVTLMGHMPESSDREEFGKSNLCFPDSCGPRGSKWLSALPIGSRLWGTASSLQFRKNLAALIYGRQICVLSGGSQWVQAQPADRPR